MSAHQRRFPADLLELRNIEPWLRTTLAGHIDDATLSILLPRVELALQEICANIVQHGDASSAAGLDIVATVDPPVLTVVIIDEGDAFDPTSAPEPDPDDPQIHGYGIMIVRRLTSRFEVSRIGTANHTRLDFDLPLPPAPPHQDPAT